ncbi:MAG: PspC domain-containing protein [Patescibacteria group bacterium]|nr:PspC domain-containing protein [Patescibacteria group bacterium]
METKKLYRSDKNKILTGVFGGIGEYLNIDPVIFRLAWLLIFIFAGIISGSVATISGSIAYLLAVVIIPKKDSSKTQK